MERVQGIILMMRNLVLFISIDNKWKENLELRDVIEEIAEDLTYGCMMSEYGDYKDPAWETKYMYMHRWNESGASV